jgi:hypothetical protein
MTLCRALALSALVGLAPMAADARLDDGDARQLGKGEARVQHGAGNFHHLIAANLGERPVRVTVTGLLARTRTATLALLGAAASQAPPPAASEGGPRYWAVATERGTLNMREAPAASSRVVARLARGTILHNLGCRQGEGRVWCDVQPLGGGPRGYVAHVYLRHAAGPDGQRATGPDDSALRAGRGEFDARGEVPCAMDGGASTRRCPFRVARGTSGDATVVIDRPDGRTRTLFFRFGRAVSADTSEADGYPPVSASREGDRIRVQVGAERYELVDAIVLGG